MKRPDCKNCGAGLTGRVRHDHTACPNCGKLWRLNAGHTAIYSQALEVQSGRHGIKTTVGGSNG